MEAVTMKNLYSFLALAGWAGVAAGADYVGGEMDMTTPQLRLVEPAETIVASAPVHVVIRYSADFRYCDDCVAPLPSGYGQLPQVAQQGHAHTYLQRIPDDGGFDANAGPDGTSAAFCALNASNPTTKVGPGSVEGDCPGVTATGRYRMCAVLQTDAHVLRVMAHPRHFPSIDCRIVEVIAAPGEP
jgi:hypothetical protein